MSNLASAPTSCVILSKSFNLLELQFLHQLNENNISPRKEARLDRRAMEKSDSDEKIYLPTVTSWYTTAVKKILTSPVYCSKI